MIVRARRETKAAARKRHGQYYTPEPLVRLILDAALDPAIARSFDLTTLRICDPACGTGHFLIPAAERLAAAISASTGLCRAEAIRHVVKHQLFGADIDDKAIRVCKNHLAELADLSIDAMTPNIRVGDALQNVFPSTARFDLILGNPPYVNAIEGGVSEETKSRLRARFPTIRGTADLSHYFLARAIELVSIGGRIGLMLPRGILNAPACASLRETLPATLRPNLLYVPEHCDWFDGAAVFASAVVLGPDGECRVSNGANIDQLHWSAGRVESGNWWLEARRILGHLSECTVHSNRRVDDVFHVVASLTTADAYDLQTAVIDAPKHAGPKLVTTGLIDPSISHWARRTCRYLKKDYTHPRVDLSVDLSPSLLRRIDQSRRPKVLVAGLTRRVECFFDSGECLGAVSTFSIFHPENDEGALRRLCAYFLSDEVTRQFIAELGGNGMRGGHVTMKKSFLKKLSLPDEIV